MQKTITWDEWNETYQPVVNENGERVELDLTDAIEITKAIENNTIWTQLDADGVMCFSSGYHFVNRMAYVTTKVPYNDDDFIEVIDQEDIDAEEFVEKVADRFMELYGIELDEDQEEQADEVRWDGISPNDYALKLGLDSELDIL